MLRITSHFCLGSRDRSRLTHRVLRGYVGLCSHETFWDLGYEYLFWVWREGVPLLCPLTLTNTFMHTHTQACTGANNPQYAYTYIHKYTCKHCGNSAMFAYIHSHTHAYTCLSICSHTQLLHTRTHTQKCARTITSIHGNKQSQAKEEANVWEILFLLFKIQFSRNSANSM